MNTFCDGLSETILMSVYDSFFRNYVSIVSLSFIVLKQLITAPVHIGTWRPFLMHVCTIVSQCCLKER